jgi:hypothetical protein
MKDVTCIQNFSGRTRREDIRERVLYKLGLRVWIAVVWFRTESSGRITRNDKEGLGSVKDGVFLSSVIFYLFIYFVVLCLLHESPDSCAARTL